MDGVSMASAAGASGSGTTSAAVHAGAVITTMDSAMGLSCSLRRHRLCFVCQRDHLRRRSASVVFDYGGS